MRKNSDSWSVTCGVKPGHYHLFKGANCQDAAVCAAHPCDDVDGQIAVGVGCDGCGEGHNSEMGAISLSSFILQECLSQHRMHRSPTETLKHIFPAVVRFIDTNVLLTCPAREVSEVAEFIKHHWLATIMGFILTDDESILFWCGDGTFAIDDEAVIELDQNNSPKYIAYNCLYRPESVNVMADDIPKSFSINVLHPETNRIMIASDGFLTCNESKRAAVLAKEELPDIHGNQWGKRGQLGLKKWMNSRSDRGHFEDDCFIVTAERICKV